MNRTFRSIWNDAIGAFVAVPENASGASRSGGAATGVCRIVHRLTPLAFALALAHGAHAAPANTQLPAGGVVQAGSASIDQAGATLTVGQTSNRAVIQWDSFSVGKNASVQFVQPNASSVALNRVVGNESSIIDGALKANGQVFLVNPNGVLFGKNAVVDVGGLVASTLDISNADFMAGGSTFSLGSRRGIVSNEGSITAADGGYIALIGQKVSNDGTLLARMGTVAMASGDQVTLNFNGNALVDVVIDRATFDAMVENHQLIVADGGLVKLTASTADALITTVVNNTGTIQSRTIDKQSGRIFLLGEGGRVEVNGTLDASAPTSGDGGFIETSGPKVTVADAASITTASATGSTGTWLVDPTDFTVAASGGDMTGATLTTLLQTNNVTLQSSAGATSGNGDVNINDAVSWSANTLTLEASNDINVNAVMTATGTAGLNLAATSNKVKFGLVSGGFTGRLDFSSSGVLQMNVNGVLTPFTVINSASQLQAMQNNLSGNYALGSDVDLSGLSWSRIGSVLAKYTGVFDGLGHTVDNMNISVTPTSTFDALDYGLFGSVTGILRNVGVTNGSINIDGGAFSVARVGLLAGQTEGVVYNTYSTGSISVSSGSGNLGMNQSIGGLIGAASSSTPVPVSVDRSFSTASVDATANGSQFEYVGGLIGFSNAYISNSYSTGPVAGYLEVGGLVGSLLGSVGAGIDHSYSTSSVVGGLGGVGGLVGSSGGSISYSYSTGEVTAIGTGNFGSVGGLVGSNAGVITDSYTTSRVNTSWVNDPTGYYNGIGYVVGAVAGVDWGHWDSATSSLSQSVSNVVYNSDVAGSLAPVGFNYDKTVDPTYGFTATQPSGVGLTTAQMMSESSYTALGWDFTSDWAIYEGHTAPLLRTFLTPLTVSTSIASTKVYDGQVDSGTAVYSAAVDPSHLLGTLTMSGASKNVGTYTVTPSGVWSDQQGYLITFSGGTTTVTPATLTVTASGGTQVYDGTRNATVSLSGNAIAGDQLTLSAGSALMDDKNAGTGKAVTVSGISLTGADAGNYVLVNTAATTTTNVTPAVLTVNASAASQYLTNGTNVNVTLSANPVAGDVLSLSNQAANVADMTAGSGRRVTVTGIGISGPDAGNYVLSSDMATTLVDILASANASDTSAADAGSVTRGAVIASAVQATPALQAQGIAAVRITPIPPASAPREGATTGSEAFFVYATPNASADGSVELSQLRSMAQVPASDPLTVPVANSKFVSLLNGGVRLPAGVEQQFFVSASSDR